MSDPGDVFDSLDLSKGESKEIVPTDSKSEVVERGKFDFYVSHLSLIDKDIDFKTQNQTIELQFRKLKGYSIIKSIEVYVHPGPWMIVTNKNNTFEIKSSKSGKSISIKIENGFYSSDEFISVVNSTIWAISGYSDFICQNEKGVYFINSITYKACSGSFIDYFFNKVGKLDLSTLVPINHLFSKLLVLKINDASITLKKKDNINEYVTLYDKEIRVNDGKVTIMFLNTALKAIPLSAIKFDIKFEVNDDVE